MGLFDFVKDAGEALFGGKSDKPADVNVVRTPDAARSDRDRGETLERRVTSSGIAVEGLDVRFRDGLATVRGAVANQADREKVVLLLGNTVGVAQVEDELKVREASAQATLYTVKSGDTLSVIAKGHYGDAGKYTAIFEANRPMLEDPNKIYPGQVLRIPPK